MDLSERAQKILNLIIDCYIKTAEPVGSAQLVKSYNLKCSSATVRNIMAELMDKGYLMQPHVSAGRVPTEKGIRFYVNSLPYPNKLPDEQKAAIERIYKEVDGTIEEVMYETGKVLSDISRCASLVTLPNTRFMKIESAKLVRLGEKKVLVIIVFEGGLTEKTLIRTERRVPKDALERMSEYLNRLAVGLTLGEMKGVLDRLRRERKIYKEFIEGVIKLSGKFEQGFISEVYIKGQTAFFEHISLSNPKEFKELIRIFEEKSFLIDVIDKVMKEDGTKVFIGSESGIMKGYSLVAASYGNDKRLGTLGVLGPMRMNYSQIIPLVDYTARIVSKIVSEGG
ncbi:Heat-inducible transcription repressor HrcA [bacterium HR37]|nr:Heat-inducible transcription repressor HrcA [bacterium HR37]